MHVLQAAVAIVRRQDAEISLHAGTPSRHGRTLTPEAIVTRATGSPMTMAPYLTYLRRKYGEVYRIPQF